MASPADSLLAVARPAVAGVRLSLFGAKTPTRSAAVIILSLMGGFGTAISTPSIVVFVCIEVSRVLGVLGAATALRAARCHGARPAERRPARTAVTIYPTPIVDGKLENCASKVAQIRLSRRAELVSPLRQLALLHSRACPTGSS